MTNKTFKQWLIEDDDMLDGALAIGDKLKSSFAAGMSKHTDLENQKKAEQDKAAADALAKETDDVINYINAYIGNLFTKFPYPGGQGGPEDFLNDFKTRSAALQAFEIYKKMATTLGKIQHSMNSRLIHTKKIDKNKLNTLLKRAKSEAASGSLGPKLESFAKSEAKFFTELLTIQKNKVKPDAFDNYQFDEAEFVSRLSNRISKTEPVKLPNAIESLNALLIYLQDEFTSYAKTIAQVGKQRAKPVSNESFSLDDFPRI